ncbi:MAG: P-II family nitrogen regulator [Bacillota bacterium]|nr:P-II family nitrogen regulator [Bacillota bacterium]
MKKLELIVRPNVAQEVIDALEKLGVGGMTVMQVDGCGKQKGQTGLYRGTEFSLHLLPKVKIEVFLPDAAVQSVIEQITSVARTGEVGDGKIFVLPAENAVRIRTGEEGEEAL